MSRTLELAKALISRRSNTPDDAGCQDMMIARLEPLGFKIERMRFGIPEFDRNALRLVGIAVEQDGARARRDERFRGGAPDPARTAGDERDLSVQPKAIEH